MKRALIAVSVGVILVGCGSDMTAPRFDDLPESVKNKVEGQSDPGQIARIEKEHDNGRTIYHIEFHQKGKLVKLAVTENGTVINDSRKRVVNEAAGAPLEFGRISAQNQFTRLPPSVQKAIGARAGNWEIVKVDQVKRGGKAAFEIEFDAPGSNPKMYVMADGNVIEDQRDVYRR